LDFIPNDSPRIGRNCGEALLIFGSATVYCMMLAVASGSVIIYGFDAFVPLSPRRGFPYALVPAVSWLLIAVVLMAAAFRTHARGKNRMA
jgi:hypothetical protein